MSRVHCIDCGTDVAVDPLGQCPAGHLLPANGRRVTDAIGNGEPHPDEPVPWVGEVQIAAAETETVPAHRAAQPRSAPGLEPAQEEVDSGDLLRELGALGIDDGGTPAAAVPSSPAPTGPAPAVNGHAADTHGPGVNGHAADARDPAVDGHSAAAQGPGVNGHTAADATVDGGPRDASELSALEQALQALGESDHDDASAPAETGHDDASASVPAASAPPPAAPDAPPAAPAPPPAASASPPPTEVDDFGGLFDEVDTSGHGAATPPPAAASPAAPPPDAVQPAAPVPPPPPAPSPAQGQDPAAPRWEALADVADLAAADTGADPGAESDGGGDPGDAGSAPSGQGPRPAIDTMNFTAKGGPGKGRRRKLFGR